MKGTFLILLTIATLISCDRKAMDMDTPTEQTTTTPANLKGPYSYLALGDSYTIGESVALTNSFPYQLKTIMGGKGYEITNPKIIAVTGWTTGDLKNAIAQANLTTKYDVVTLLIGVNNQYRGYSQTDYRTEFVQLLNTAIGFASGNKQHVFVLSIPDYSVTPFAATSDKVKIATEIDQFNAINKYESTKAGVNYLDITGISRQASFDSSLIAQDGLHPSAKMYGLWANQLAIQVAAQLSK